MKAAYENEITLFVNGCLASYTGKKSELKRCLEIILGLKKHNPEALFFEQVEPIQFMLENPSLSLTLTPTEVPEAKALIRKLLTETHDALVKKQFLAEELAPDDSQFVQLFGALNQYRLNNPIDTQDENQQPEGSSPPF